MFELIYKIIICHIVGDFLFQNSFLANTKGENWYHLFAHCVLYSLPFYLCFGFGWQLAVISVLLFPIDALKARYGKINSWQDQALHYLLCLVYLL